MVNGSLVLCAWTLVRNDQQKHQHSHTYGLSLLSNQAGAQYKKHRTDTFSYSFTQFKNRRERAVSLLQVSTYRSTNGYYMLQTTDSLSSFRLATSAASLLHPRRSSSRLRCWGKRRRTFPPPNFALTRTFQINPLFYYYLLWNARYVFYLQRAFNLFFLILFSTLVCYIVVVVDVMVVVVVVVG